MKLKIDWVKLKNFFLWLFDLRCEKFILPVKCRIHKKNEKSLIGKAYYFCDLEYWEVTSPIRGKVSKIYPNFAIQITNNEGLQILINIQVDRENPMPLDKVFQCQIEEGQEVDYKTTLFVVYLEEQVISVSVYIPWQPEVIGRVESFNKSNNFAKVYYRNPYSKLRFKKHGKY
ncbi:MAG: hypothetical protein mread185_000061 [Mycoplasmataceae bacterium]|nr:MAG: hypothetical protein mread185_000061 [Mycoplasmataceae bacterium]